MADVTNEQPPHGSIVVFQDRLWIRGPMGWREYGVGKSDTLPWRDISRHVQKVIREGLHW